MTAIGSRVGALLSIKNNTVYFLGYGVYAGDEVPPSDINPALNLGRPNPKIQLDNGKTVWGMECWWGDEAKMKAQIAEYVAKGYAIVDTDIDAARARIATQQ